MASKLIPPNPDKVMVIRTIPTTRIVTCSLPFSRFGRIHIGGRGTIVPLQNNDLAVFSPVALTPEVRNTIETGLRGTVKYLVALDQEHHLYLSDWQKAFPQAKVVMPEPLVSKRQRLGLLLPDNIGSADCLLKPITKGSGVDDEFDREFDVEYVDAHQNKELVFNHKPTKTLIQADVMFNLPATEQMSKSGISPETGLLTKIFCKINNTKGAAMGQRRFLWWLISAKDRPSFNKSIARINAWDFDRIIPCHGDVIETGGHAVFRKARYSFYSSPTGRVLTGLQVFQWHLEGAGHGGPHGETTADASSRAAPKAKDI